MASGSDIRSIMDMDPAPVPPPPGDNQRAPPRIVTAREPPKPQPRRFKKSAIRSRGRAARWVSKDTPAATARSDELQFRRWFRPTANNPDDPVDRFSRYNTQPEIPTYDDDVYAKHLANTDWTREETDYLLEVYRDCSGKWPVVIDHYDWSPRPERTMEDLKSRFYSIAAAILQLNTPITSMTASEYNMFETLTNFDPTREIARKKLVEAHLKRHQSEVDEESVLLSELQRIMLNQANLDTEREELRKRLDYPHANTNGYQYSTSQALTTLWQQLLAADRMKKNQRLRPTGNPTYDGMPTGTPTTARPRESNAAAPDSAPTTKGRANRESTSGVTQSGLPVDLSKADMLRYGVVQSTDKLPSGVTFASDKLSKPRIAKSSIQTEKIAKVLEYAQVPSLIPLPTPSVIEQFDAIMSKVHALLDMRKLKDKEEQEVRTREAELAR